MTLSMIDEIRQALYAAEDQQEIQKQLEKLEIYLGDHLKSFDSDQKLPVGAFELVLEVLSNSKLYTKLGMGDFVDFYYADMFTDSQKQQILDAIYQNFNNYLEHTTIPFLGDAFFMLKDMYSASNQGLSLIDSLAKLYLSTTESGHEFIQLCLLPEDRQALQRKVKELQVQTF